MFNHSTTADLTIYPQNGTFIPGAHLNIRESQRVQKDWFDFGVIDKGETAGEWLIQFVFESHSSFMSIPRSATATSAAMAVAA